ncbi:MULTISPECIES: two-component system regulatory protein YycI [Enterococcus]|uniref:two-component system regulatory protein YycI n=1 Tax=Enterococcus sp. AZ103 TaxID=2774628 RepID=UPI003F216F3D
MDFRKIEWLFILVFISLNIFLFNIYQSSQDDQQAVTTTYNQKEGITSRLKNDNITFKGKISTKKPEGYYLSAEQVNVMNVLSENNIQDIMSTSSISDNVLTNYLGQPRRFNMNRIKSSFNRAMKDDSFIYEGTSYQYISHISKEEKDDVKIVGAQNYEGIPFIDETSRVTLDIDTSGTNAEVTQYTQTLLRQIEPLREKMTLYSEEEILNTLYINNNIPANSTIQDIYLGYFRTIEVGEKNVYVPVWFVKIQTSDDVSQIERVNAMSNQVISNNLVPKVENP